MTWRTAVDRAVGPFGLTHAQYVLLATPYGMSLAGARPSQRELADTTGLEPVYVSRLARALEEAGLIDRTESAADPRAVELSLTERGDDVVIQAIAVVGQLHDELLEPIGGPTASKTAVSGARSARCYVNLLMENADHDSLSTSCHWSGHQSGRARNP